MTPSPAGEDVVEWLNKMKMVVEWSSGEEPATSRMLPAERPSGEVLAADIASDPDAAIGVHPPVDRSSTGEHETVDALTEPYPFRISGLDGDRY